MKAEREDGLDVLGRDRHHGCSQVASSLLEAAVAASDGIALTDADGRFTFMNASHASLFGYDKPADLLRQSWKILYNDDAADRLVSYVFREIERHGRWTGELEGVSRKGEPVFQEVTLSRFAGGLLCITRGIQIREQLREERARLASLVREIEARQAAARLGAQIGHDLANFLAALRFQAELIEEADLKRTITRTTDRAFEVVKYLQDTAKRELSPPAAFDLVDFLDESVETARALCPAGVNLEAENSFELGEVRCLVDRSVLERSLLNLVKNSVEAGSSEIKINLLKGEESRRMFDRSIATFGSIGDGSFVVLVVDDNGSGIAAHEVEKLSIWGFSTKSLEGGPVRGLGFLTLTALTSLYGAEVSVQSKRNVGTAVTVRLPTM